MSETRQHPAGAPALVTTFHDPQGRLRWVIEGLAERTDPPGLSALRRTYQTRIALVTAATDATVRSILADHDFSLLVHDSESRYASNWLALEAGLESDAARFHHCDLDRFLHWLLRCPQELFHAAERIPTTGLLMFRRTERAFSSHPITQQLTEGPANRLAARVFGIAGIDLFSGSFGFGRDAAESLVRNGVRSDASFFVEALNVPFQSRMPVDSCSVEGLEWETPDQYRREIDLLGYEEWLNRFQSHEEWKFRTEMAARWIELCCNAGSTSNAKRFSSSGRIYPYQSS